MAMECKVVTLMAAVERSVALEWALACAGECKADME